MELTNKKSSRDLRQEQCVSKWVQAKGHGTIVGATGFGFLEISCNSLNFVFYK